MRFQVTGEKTERKEFECFADSPRHAIKMFREHNPGFIPEGVAELVQDGELAGEAEYWESLGRCEACEAEILEGDDYRPDSEGGALFCPKCVERFIADSVNVAAAGDLLRELKHLVRLLEPLEQEGGLNVPGLATLNGARAAIAKAVN